MSLNQSITHSLNQSILWITRDCVGKKAIMGTFVRGQGDTGKEDRSESDNDKGLRKKP